MIYDCGIIGMGVAGVFCAHRLATTHKDMKIFGIDLGRPQGKRRRQIEGWLGCLPNSDGKLYQTDISKVSEITGVRKAKSAHTAFKHVFEQIDDYNITKDRAPSVSMDKKIKKLGYNVILNDYVQMYPKEIHSLSKYMADTIELNKNITFSFDNEVKGITKQKNVFIVSTDLQEFRCKKLIIATGRSGWRWAKALYENFGIIDSDDFAKFGIRVEANSNVMKDFNRSSCTLVKENLELGPMSWYGTVIPEDHIDLAISAFRSNENRWKTDKVSFSLIGNIPFPNEGFKQTDRIGKLTFILANDRIIRERISTILSGKSKISVIKEYEWLKPVLNELTTIIPEIATKINFHAPTIIPTIPKINIGDNLETEVDGLYVVGEAAGVNGILSAGLMGIIAADSVSK